MKFQKTRTYNIWTNMKQRCFNEINSDYPNYGGRGITVCEEWKDEYQSFLRDMGECPPDLTIDRIDNDGNYEPGNCRWATQAVQRRNQRRIKMLTYNGETLCLKDWATRLQVSRRALRYRIDDLQWSTEKALTIPFHKSLTWLPINSDNLLESPQKDSP